MKRIALIIIAILISVNVYAVTKEEAAEIKAYLFIQGKTAERLNGLFEDLNEGLVSFDLVHDKLMRWSNDYKAETEPVPEEAEDLDGLMNEYFDVMGKYILAYKVKDERNAPALKEKAEEVYQEIKREEGEIRVEIGEE